MVLTDETGLHSVDCECERCEAGYRPTELERSAARRALALRLAAEARMDARNAPPAASPRRELPAYPMPRPYTAEELADMDAELRARGIRR